MPRHTFYICALIATLCSATTRADNGDLGSSLPDLSAVTANTDLLIGFEAYNGPIDDDIGATFGFNLGLNKGFALIEEHGIGGQVGGRAYINDWNGNSTTGSGGDDGGASEFLGFLTAGIFRKAKSTDPNASWQDRLSAGLVYDQMRGNNAGEEQFHFILDQIRGKVGLAQNKDEEIGVMFTHHTNSDFIKPGVRVKALDRFGAYCSKRYESGMQTLLGLGWADEPGALFVNTTIMTPTGKASALYVNLTYVHPDATSGEQEAGDGFNEDFWAIGFGLSFSLDGSGKRGAWAPMMPLPDNGSFGVATSADEF